MGRPGDWSVLGYGSDPIDADVDEFVAEATHYELMADAITSQIATLRHLSNSGEGEYADALRSSCDDLADNLEKAEGRFRTVADELNDLVPKLEEALDETWQARIQAQNAQDDMDTAVNQGHRPGIPASTRADEELPSGKDPAALENDYDNAVTARTQARTRAQNAVSAWDTAAEAAASRIRKAADDDLKDGRFEGFKAWVKANADLLREISKWLGRIVLVLTVIVLIVGSGGAAFILLVAASVALLAVDTVLAIAGEGSWTDVAFSALGVLTLGTGGLLARMARSGRAVTAARAGRAQGFRSGMQTLRNAFNNPGLRGGFTNLRNVFRPSTYLNALDDAGRVSQAIRSAPINPSSMWRGRNLISGRDALTLSDDLADLAQFARPGLQHRLGVWSSLRHTEIATGATYFDGALDELQNLGIDPFGIDRRTTREVSSL